MAKKKDFLISMGMKWAHDFIVVAENKTEARKKAMERMAIISKKQSEFNIEVEEA